MLLMKPQGLDIQICLCAISHDPAHHKSTITMWKTDQRLIRRHSHKTHFSLNNYLLPVNALEAFSDCCREHREVLSIMAGEFAHFHLCNLYLFIFFKSNEVNSTERKMCIRCLVHEGKLNNELQPILK